MHDLSDLGCRFQQWHYSKQPVHKIIMKDILNMPLRKKKWSWKKLAQNWRLLTHREHILFNNMQQKLHTNTHVKGTRLTWGVHPGARCSSSKPGARCREVAQNSNLAPSGVVSKTYTKDDKRKCMGLFSPIKGNNRFQDKTCWKESSARFSYTFIKDLKIFTCDVEILKILWNMKPCEQLSHAAMETMFKWITDDWGQSRTA